MNSGRWKLTHLLLAMGAAACAAHAPPSVPAVEADRAALFAAEDRLAAALGAGPPVDALDPVLAPDVVLALPGADLARGREAARRLLDTPALAATTTVHHRSGGATSRDGRAGYTFGWLLRRATGGTAFGKYLAAWRLEPGGWRIEAFLWREAKRAPAEPPPLAAGGQGIARPGAAGELTRSVLATDAEFAALSVARGYFVAFGRYADERSVCFTNGDFQLGPAGIRDVFGGWTPEEELSWEPRVAGAAASGDLAWTVGLGTLRVGTGARATYAYSNYLTVWARQADGSWRWLLDAGSPRPPPR